MLCLKKSRISQFPCNFCAKNAGTTYAQNTVFRHAKFVCCVVDAITMKPMCCNRVIVQFTCMYVHVCTFLYRYFTVTCMRALTSVLQRTHLRFPLWEGRLEEVYIQRWSSPVENGNQAWRPLPGLTINIRCGLNDNNVGKCGSRLLH